MRCTKRDTLRLAEGSVPVSPWHSYGAGLRDWAEAPSSAASPHPVVRSACTGAVTAATHSQALEAMHRRNWKEKHLMLHRHSFLNVLPIGRRVEQVERENNFPQTA